MVAPTDRRGRAQQFRQRLAQAMADSDMSQSALARAVGVDRSTVSQLLAQGGVRLPNAHVAAECAAALGISADWLLGLSDRPERTADLLAASLRMTETDRALVDEQILAWHQEAQGYKIRHVPATLPDMLKTPEMLEWEYSPHLGRSAAQAIQVSQERLEWMRSGRSDYEFAIPLHEVTAFAASEGYYRDLPETVRAGQLAHMIELSAQLYPALRVYLFDARRLFSSPITVFGPRLAVLYLGQHYLSFRDSERVDRFTRHFDTLVREAAMTAWGPGHYAFNARFEAMFAGYLGLGHAASLPHATSALHLALAAGGVGPGAEVIGPDVTWIASMAPVSYVGASPVFVDILPDTWCLDPAAVEAAIKELEQCRAMLLETLGKAPPVRAPRRARPAPRFVAAARRFMSSGNESPARRPRPACPPGVSALRPGSAIHVQWQRIAHAPRPPGVSARRVRPAPRLGDSCPVATNRPRAAPARRLRPAPRLGDSCPVATNRPRAAPARRVRPASPPGAPARRFMSSGNESRLTVRVPLAALPV